MSERTSIHRELTKQTVLLFCVFALLFALLGASIYSIMSANIFRSADEDLKSIGEDMSFVALDQITGTAEETAEAEGLSPAEGDIALGDMAPEFSYSIQQYIVDANPQFITLMRDAQGSMLDTVGIYATYPSYLNNIPFNAGDLDHIYQVSAGNHTYRGITYALADDGTNVYLQVLVNVDSELAILDEFTRALILYLAVAVVVSAAAGYLLSRRTLKPIVESWRIQTEFVQNASHELRTPLAIIQTTGELLLDHPNSRIVDRFEDVSTITSETKRLARLMEGLMTLSLDDAGRTTITASTVDVDTLVHDIAAVYDDFASMQDKRLSVEATFGRAIEVDADKLRQLLGIVLDNALKYTTPGDEIVMRTRASGTKCIIEVADTGCGIEPGELEHVFERFYRADKARSRETGGHGLGLSLARTIAEAHGGTIALAANDPRGTVATITLPAKAS